MRTHFCTQYGNTLTIQQMENNFLVLRLVIYLFVFFFV